ncbi:hypothetical protein CsSME_00029269 [Camellia sinensis var. sinensis]
MSAPFCQALSYRPSLLSHPISRARVLKFSKSPLPLNRTSLLLGSLSKSSKHKWQISCFRHEDTSSEFLEPENVDDKLPEILVNPEFEQSNIGYDDWASSLRKVFFTSFGWTVSFSFSTLVGIIYCSQYQSILLDTTFVEYG